MYLTYDLAAPIMGSYINNTRIRNIILAHWPKKYVDGYQVFDKLFIYNGSVVQSENHNEIYRLLNTSYEDLSSQSYKGVEDVWFELNPFANKISDITSNELLHYINNTVEFGISYEVRIIYQQDMSLESSLDIQNKMLNGAITDLFYDLEGNAVSTLVLLDTSNQIFDRSITVRSRVTQTNGTQNIEAILKYTLNSSLDTTYLTALEALAGKVNTAVKEPSLYGSDTYSITRGCRLLLQEYGHFVNNNLFYSRIVSSGTGQARQTRLEEYVRVDGFEQMDVHQVSESLKKMIKTDYNKKSSDWAGVAGFVVFIAAIIITVATSGAGTGAFAFLSSLSLNLTVAFAVNSLLVYGFQRWGDYGAAISMGKVIVGFTPIMQLVAILTFLTGIGAAMQTAKEAIKQTATNNARLLIQETTVEAVTQVVEPTLTQYVEATVELVVTEVTNSLGSVLKNSVDFLNQAFNMYTTYIAPLKDPGTPPSETIEPDNMETIELVQADFDTYSFLEMNEKMKAMPYTMTQGTIDQTFNNYYSGAA